MVAPCELTVLMPCLNEAETIGICVKNAREYIDSRNPGIVEDKDLDRIDAGDAARNVGDG